MTDAHALSGAYAIDALDDDEREVFEQHLAGCEDCRLEVASLQEAGALLGVDQHVAPPVDLRERVLADIAVVRPLPPLTASSGSVVSLSSRRHAGRRRTWPALAAAAAAVAVIGAGSVLWNPLGGNDDLVAEAPPTSSAPSVDPVQQIIDAPDAETIAQGLDVGGSATVFRSRDLGEAAVVTRGLPAPGRGKDYQLWLRVDGEMIPAGLQDTGDFSALLAGNATDAEAIGITVEPDGGSDHPTTQPVAYVPFEQA